MAKRLHPQSIPAKVAVRGWLIANGKTQVWLASKLGIGETMFSLMLSGRRTRTPEFENGVRRHTGIDIRELSEVA